MSVQYKSSPGHRIAMSRRVLSTQLRMQLRIAIFLNELRTAISGFCLNCQKKQNPCMVRFPDLPLTKRAN